MNEWIKPNFIFIHYGLHIDSYNNYFLILIWIPKQWENNQNVLLNNIFITGNMHGKESNFLYVKLHSGFDKQIPSAMVLKKYIFFFNSWQNLTIGRLDTWDKEFIILMG